MALTRQYPQNIVPKGTKVQQAITNDDNEFKRIYEILSTTGALQLFGDKRQSVLYGATDSSGNPNFLTASGLTISIDGSAKPVILAFANGFSPTQGTVDVLDKIDSLISAAWTLPASNTCYLYIDKDISTGLLSYGYTTSADQYLKAAPSSPVLDQCYFNTNEMKMYHYNGSAWEVKQRIFVASVVTTASAATVAMYPMISKASLKSNLASITTGQGASLIGVSDTNGKFAGTTVEEVLAELGKRQPITLYSGIVVAAVAKLDLYFVDYAQAGIITIFLNAPNTEANITYSYTRGLSFHSLSKINELYFGNATSMNTYATIEADSIRSMLHVAKQTAVDSTIVVRLIPFY